VRFIQRPSRRAFSSTQDEDFDFILIDYYSNPNENLILRSRISGVSKDAELSAIVRSSGKSGA
jgi:hypothetical protein